jgi:uncharacterized protein (UPF0262 family)
MPSVMPSQEQMYYAAVRSSTEVNLQFLEFVKDGLTREELQTNINRRPGLWGRFSAWLDKLPSTASTQPLPN